MSVCWVTSQTLSYWKAKYITTDKTGGPFFYFKDKEEDLDQHPFDVVKHIINTNARNYRNVKIGEPLLNMYCDLQRKHFVFKGRYLETPHAPITSQGNIVICLNLMFNLLKKKKKFF